MKYDEISHDDALVQIEEHPDAEEMDDRIRSEIIEASDVLYWMDAFGDLSLAINCQGLPKDLPDDVIRSINEWDALNDWQGKVSELNCPLCSRTIYEFDWQYDYLYVDEHGDEHQHVEYISDHSGGYYWDANEEHRIMCQACREHREFHGWRNEPSSNSVRFFYGETDKFSRFSHQSGVIRWDFEWDYEFDNSTDIWNHREDNETFIEGHEIAAAFAQSRSARNDMMKRCGFEKVHVKELGVTRRGVKNFWSVAENVLKGWATISHENMKHESTHPDMDFTYIIEGTKQAWVPSEKVDKFEAELIWQTLREVNDLDDAKQYRKEHDNLLSA